MGRKARAKARTWLNIGSLWTTSEHGSGWGWGLIQHIRGRPDHHSQLFSSAPCQDTRAACGQVTVQCLPEVGSAYFLVPLMLGLAP